ncbi:LysR family transcriptional regulator [Aliamphritea spongicola]|nr:LysR family transcriptional regulator [Aliamphritea spongicola]
MERLNLNLLRSLAVLLEQRNVTQSAEQLNMSQSALSKQLAQLRDYFDDKLLIRNGNDYLLTSFAQRLNPRLQEIISQLENLRDETDFNPQHCRRRFTFACTDYVANFIFPDVICSLSQQAPPSICCTASGSRNGWIILAACPSTLPLPLLMKCQKTFMAYIWAATTR